MFFGYENGVLWMLFLYFYICFCNIIEEMRMVNIWLDIYYDYEL